MINLRITRRLVTRAVLTILALGSSLLPAHAMNVSPMIAELLTTGARSTARIQLLDTLPKSLPYEVRVYRIQFDDRGVITETPADQDFLVFPPQGVVKPGQRQMIRIQWIGGAVDSSRGYYVSINQVPAPLVASEASKTQPVVDVRVVYHMKVLVTVSPKGAMAKVKVIDAKPAMVEPDHVGGAPLPGIAVTAINTGQRHAMLAAATWTVDGKDKSGKPLHVVIPATKMNELLGAGYLPALTGKRTFLVPTGVEFSDAPISVKFSD